VKRSKSLKPASSSEQSDVRNIIAILHKWGIRTLGQLAALDKEQVAARLGPAAVRMWERASGKSERLLKLVSPPEQFEESFEFEREIETAEPLLFILRRFLEQLALRLGSIYLVAEELTLQITFGRDKAIYRRVFKIPQPTNDVDLLFRMLGTHLENFRSEHPIVAVALQARPIKPASQQFGLFETALRNPQQLYETLARLAALLGSDRVGTPFLEETHRPDAFRMEPFTAQAVASAVPSGKEHQSGWDSNALRTAHTTAALRRFRPAVPASMFRSKNSHLQSPKVRGRIGKQRGPYSLSGNWWDEQSWERAEWDVELEDGTLCRCHRSGGAWAIDGIYD
jgi:protein ImuB